MNLAVRDIRCHRGRFVQTCLGLGLLLAVVMSMGGIYRGLVADALAILEAIGADVWVVQQGTSGPFAATSRMPEDLKYRIRAVPGVSQASPSPSRISNWSASASRSASFWWDTNREGSAGRRPLWRGGGSVRSTTSWWPTGPWGWRWASGSP